MFDLIRSNWSRQHDFPEAKVEIKDEKAPLTRDFRVDRVRIAVDKDGKVTRAPATG